MPSLRVRNADTPIGRLRNVDIPVASVLNTDVPTVQVRNTDIPNARITEQSGLGGSTTTTVDVGVPIGLLLALTYAERTTATAYQPVKIDLSVRIRNTD